jgi:hypothetical protein
MSVAYNPSIVQNGLVLCLDPANKKSYSQNEFRYTTDIFGWIGTSGGNACTLSRDSISSPAGNTPLKMAISGNDPNTPTYNSGAWNVAPAANGQTWVVSVYAKASVATTGEIFIFGANSAGTGFVDGAWLTIAAGGFNITTEWTRVSFYATMNNPSISFIQLRLDGTPSGGSGQTIWWDGLQVERVPSGTTSPTPYTSKYYGGSVFKDLSNNNNNGTLFNGVEYSTEDFGELSGNSVNRYIQLTGDGLGNSFSSFSLGIVARTRTGTGADTYGYLYHRSAAQTVGSSCMYLSMASNQLVFGINGNANQVVVNATANNVLAFYNIVWNGTVVTIYQNSVQVTSFNFSTFTNSRINNFFNLLGTSVAPTYRPGNHDLFNFHMYNRALTQAEITQNFNALRSRYGL